MPVHTEVSALSVLEFQNLYDLANILVYGEPLLAEMRNIKAAELSYRKLLG